MYPFLASRRADGTPPRHFPRTAAAVIIATVVLTACVQPIAPDGTILSRLPPGAPGAAAPVATTPPPDADEQARRYDQIDRQALKDSENAIRAEDAARTARALAAQSSLSFGYGYGGYGGYGWGGPAYYGPGWYGGGWGGRGWGGPRSGVFIGQSWGW